MLTLCGSPTFIPFLFTLIRVWHLDNKVLPAPADNSLFERIRRVIKEMFPCTKNQNKQSSNVLQCQKVCSASFSSKRAHACPYGKASTIICSSNSPTSTQAFHKGKIKACKSDNKLLCLEGKGLFISHQDVFTEPLCKHTLVYCVRDNIIWDFWHETAHWLVHKLQKWWKIKCKKINYKTMMVQVFLQLKQTNTIQLSDSFLMTFISKCFGSGYSL